jgi:hypothetical protein
MVHDSKSDRDSAPTQRRFALHRRPALLFTGTVLTSLLGIVSCEGNARAPAVIVSGYKSWYHATKAESSYLLDAITRDGAGVLEWPPREETGLLYVSFDLTCSVFERKVLHNNRRLTLAEYNTSRLSEFLHSQDVVSPGDLLIVKVFGTRPGGDDVLYDLSAQYHCPPLRLHYTAERFSRRFNDLAIEVDRPQADPGAPAREAVDSVITWCGAAVRSAPIGDVVPNDSPLLESVRQVIQAAVASRRQQIRIIFVTDGHFDFPGGYFSPATFQADTGILGRVLQRTTHGSILPSPTPSPISSIVFLGMDDRGCFAFRGAWEQIMTSLLADVKIGDVEFLWD